MDDEIGDEEDGELVCMRSYESDNDHQFFKL